MEFFQSHRAKMKGKEKKETDETDELFKTLLTYTSSKGSSTLIPLGYIKQYLSGIWLHCIRFFLLYTNKHAHLINFGGPHSMLYFIHSSPRRFNSVDSRRPCWDSGSTDSQIRTSIPATLPVGRPEQSSGDGSLLLGVWRWRNCFGFTGCTNHKCHHGWS